MQNKKIKIFLCAIMIAITSLTFTACNLLSYGESYNNIEEIKAELAKNEIDLLYPSFETAGASAEEYKFISNIDVGSDKLIGYKIYHFDSPFYICVYGYNSIAEDVISTDKSLVSACGDLLCNKGTINMFEGELHKNTMYLIGIINIKGKHYEVRVSADETMDGNGKYVNAISKDNDNYHKAQQVIIDIMEGLQ